MKKCVAKRKLVGFRQEALDRIQEHMKRAETDDETEAIHQMLAGEIFGPTAEGWIKEQMDATGKSRIEVLEEVILWARAQLVSEQPAPRHRGGHPSRAERQRTIEETKSAARQLQEEYRRREGSPKSKPGNTPASNHSK